MCLPCGATMRRIHEPLLCTSWVRSKPERRAEPSRKHSSSLSSRPSVPTWRYASQVSGNNEAGRLCCNDPFCSMHHSENDLGKHHRRTEALGRLSSQPVLIALWRDPWPVAAMTPRSPAGGSGSSVPRVRCAPTTLAQRLGSGSRSPESSGPWPQAHQASRQAAAPPQARTANRTPDRFPV